MGNPKTSTKVKIRHEEDLPLLVKRAVEAIMTEFRSNGVSFERIEVPFGEEIFWESRPRFSDPHWTKITFYGHTRFECGAARYEGAFGIWTIDITPWFGPSPDLENARREPCVRTWGKAHCIHPSDEWRETQEQLRERLKKWFEEGVL